MTDLNTIKREQQATIGRYALAVDDAHEPAIISFTRPRPHVVYLTFARAPVGADGAAALEALIAAIASDARENGDRIVLANREMETMFGAHPQIIGLRQSA